MCSGDFRGNVDPPRGLYMNTTIPNICQLQSAKHSQIYRKHIIPPITAFVDDPLVELGMNKFMEATKRDDNVVEVKRLTGQHEIMIAAMGHQAVYAPVDFRKPGLRVLDSATADGTQLSESCVYMYLH